MCEKPCLVDIHGGPHYFRDAYYMECLNILVNQGYLILAVNYSGSWTFGSEFNDRLAGKMGKDSCWWLIVGHIDVNEIVEIIKDLQAKR